MNKEKMQEMLLQGYLLYEKNGIIDLVEKVDFGQIIFKFKGGKIYQVDRTQTIK
ncbi:hypothetical protein [Streptococcus parauberis]|uniref:DUF2292 domain-containing protein n=1 Tax=Streptococcus parauberis NCFD 2020 TaxID=873447 RepID=F1YWZ9_9STRE|nr:hypothetical protein [Streptococcus parauberis]QBX09964.1 hypothetical protein JavanS401_0005 [Streptococcus satellite phage Javan401]QBX09991.1 hypothetical protein JavanS402_0013 [Streptococcus satellite phage Javan402]EGE53129.1 hypothetical protein SPB_1474 [Streptococcus parauberis NCFD 2020]EGE54696.1 hypothetical protein SPB_0003 [Streptococcus parauberis NCFD 2020]PNY18718.1 hypothetical protein ASN86_01672 [Streptococcus parauberis]